MKWFKHLVDSGGDPDIDDAITLFGMNGYYVFFRTLEVMAREFDPKHPARNVFSVQFFRKKFRISWKKVTEILKYYDGKGRILIEFSKDAKLDHIHLNCPKLKELCDDYTKKQLNKLSEQSSDTNPNKLPHIEAEEEGEEDNKTLTESRAEALSLSSSEIPKRRKSHKGPTQAERRAAWFEEIQAALPPGPNPSRPPKILRVKDARRLHGIELSEAKKRGRKDADATGLDRQGIEAAGLAAEEKAQAEMLAGFQAAAAHPDWQAEGGKYIPGIGRCFEERVWEKYRAPPAETLKAAESNPYLKSILGGSVESEQKKRSA